MGESDEMVKLLLSGAKMLGLHCPNCRLPLFQRGERVVCVKCGAVKIVEGE